MKKKKKIKGGNLGTSRAANEKCPPSLPGGTPPPFPALPGEIPPSARELGFLKPNPPPASSAMLEAWGPRPRLGNNPRAVRRSPQSPLPTVPAGL